ncbi:hypothetical protein [Bacteroides clarus]|uniref:hypothetical protein n=1 Tax=Bacteroides clarus TaxID=626929 RepID=UPI001E65DE46|nr:hypothetical protein [Bacteroides clarus]
MDKSKPYKQQEPESQVVNEAAMMYEASPRSIDDFIASIPVDLMQRLAEFAVSDAKRVGVFRMSR